MTTKKVSLIEYASINSPNHKKPCMYCEIPERVEMEEAALKGVSRRLINNWLMESQGYKKEQGFTENRIDVHFREHVKRGVIDE